MRSELSNLRRKSRQTEPIDDEEQGFEHVDDDSPEAWVGFYPDSTDTSK
jgi:hypothetical protein